MPLIGFRKEYRESIEQGLKRCTIRKLRKKGNPKAGDDLHLYTGLRTSSCKKIGTFKCTVVTPISIHWKPAELIILDGKPLSPADAQHLAKKDGFVSIDTFMDFFKGTYNKYAEHQEGLDGLLIEWL